MTSRDERELRSALEDLPEPTRAALEHHHFDPDWLVSLAERMKAGELRNEVTGQVGPPAPGDVVDLPAPGSAEHEELARAGREALSSGQCALVVLAGGMATRMGGVVKALVEALPGQSFLDLRLRERDELGRRYGTKPPLWLMTSHATDERIRQALGSRLGDGIQTFVQGLSVRLTPDGQLFRNDAGEPSVHAPGHGDLPDALRRSGLLDGFVRSGGKYVLVTNLDNLGGGLDPVLVGLHVTHEEPVTCEVVDKLGSDRGGIPVRLDGRPVVLEEFRIPPGFDPSQVRVFNVNSFGFDAEALATTPFSWTYFKVDKNVDGRTAVQFERLIGEVTSTLPTRYVRVPRTGPGSRFLPVKDHDELAARRGELEEVAQARGLL